jgi:hypothetical protein
VIKLFDHLNELKQMGETALDAMEEHANQLGIPGVAVFLYMEDSQAKDLCSIMRIVGAIHTIAEDKTGYNFIAIAYSKLAESIESWKDSGSPTRPLLVGEYGYQGSAVARIGNGLAIVAFSGRTTGDVDYEIAKSGLKRLEENK